MNKPKREMVGILPSTFKLLNKFEKYLNEKNPYEKHNKIKIVTSALIEKIKREKPELLNE